ncbi:MAG: SUMF1/EgtB/PvdO family nonheme iron enzyme [Prevotella sp.]|nr:SUMF1/EgtB/PvdO family nonheme iron enzyme [Prevotella sp.]
MTNKYDIFISYRRDGGAQYARILQLMLIQRGYKVFLDYDELTDGVFSDKIVAAIKEAPVFMLVLSKGSMTRCANDGDWVRKEITLAVEQGKHIVPVNPDNGFNGFPEGMPEELKDFIGSHQHSEISFGQALGATIDLMIKNRLVPTLGERVSNEHKDTDFETAQETLRKQDAHNRFMKRVGIIGALAIVLIVLGTCLWFWHNQQSKNQTDAEMAALRKMRTEIQDRHKVFSLQFSPDLTSAQMNTIDTLLQKMSPVRPDTLWMSQYEFTVGQWYGIKGEPYDEAQKDMPMTNVSYGDIYLFLGELGDMTNLQVALPSVEEWEYAAHGGENKETTLYVGDDDVNKVAWYKDNSEGHPHPSDGQQGKDPNMLDLYDMSGNVSELCNSPFDESGLYTICGGNYDSPASEVTAGARKGFATDAKDQKVGFRIIIRK